MANKDTLIKMFEGIRDERTKHANTARRIGNAFLSMLDFASSAGDGKLSSVHDDIAQGFITFVKGLMSNQLAQLKGGASFGSDGSYSFDKDGNLVIESAQSRDFDEMLQNGFALKRNPASGKYTLSISDLIVWGRMVINTLETRKKYAIGGNVYLSGASSKIQHVEKVYSEDGETVVGYKCYILKDDGTMATQNNWVVRDQALCQTFDIEEGVYQNVSNQYYWRLVTQVSEENVAITEKYTDKDGNEQIRELYEGQKFAWVVLSKDDCDTNSGIPASGDTIVLDGHRLTENEDTDYTERTNVLMLEATGSGSPRIIALTGVVDYKHTTDNEVFILSPQKVIFTTEHFEIRTAAGAPITFVHFMGPWVKDTEYHYYDQVSHANALWTCIVEKGKSTTEEPTDGSTYWRKEMSGGKGEKGDKGEDGLSGNGIVPAYIRSEGNPTLPTSTDKNNLDNGWSLTIPSVGDVENVSYSDSSWADYNDDSGCTWKKSPTTAASSTSSCLVTFTTTKANQVVKFVIKSFSEPRYDYIFLSEIDAGSVPSRPTSNGRSRAVSGNGVELSVTDIIATAGTHTVYVCYGKDNSGDFHGDYGLFRIGSAAGIPLWQSNGKEVFTRDNSGVIKSEIESWSEPFKVTGEDGTDGKDAVSYNVTLTRGSNGVTQGLYVGVTRYIGTACTTGTIIELGMSCKAYTDGTLAEGLTDRLQTTDNYIDFSAFPKAKSFTVELFDKNSNKVATGNYSAGDDAISILLEDAPLVFDTDDNGTVPSSVTKTAKVKVMKGNTNVTNDCTQLSSMDDLSSNCMCDVKKDEDNGCISVSVRGNWISKNDVIVDGVNQGQVSATSGYAVAQFVYAGVVYFAQVPFSVNVAKFTGVVAFNNKSYKIQYDELSKNAATKDELKNATSTFEQTAREISLSVSEKTIGRRNLLIGSAARKYGEGWLYMSSGSYYNDLPCESISINGGINGVNAILCRTKQIKTSSYYLCGYRWCGNSQQGNIKLEKGKTYYLSFYGKTASPSSVYFVAEVLYEGSKTDTSRPLDYAGPIGYTTTFSASASDTWTLFTTKIEMPSNAPYEYVEVNIFARARIYTVVEAYLCKPMLEEGDTYGGWTLSEQDYGYVGGNLLDNARTLAVGGNLTYRNGTLLEAGYGDCNAIRNFLAYGSTQSDISEILIWDFNSSYLTLGKDYILSFLAKCESEGGRIVLHLWSKDNKNTPSAIFVECSNGEFWWNQIDGNVAIELSTEWRRYWVHWRPLKSGYVPRQLIIRHTGYQNSAGSYPATNVYVTQPKLEEGATLTEYTERKSDLIDKASLKAAGIEITSDQVILYGNKVQVKNPKANPSEGYDEAAMFQNGKLNAQFINAGDIVAEGINAKKITATKLNVTGDSKIGIWHITKVDGWGNIMQAEGTEYNGATVVSGIQYCPLFVRGGSPNTAYFRVGASCTEFSYQSTLNHFNAVWFGDAARIVCKGSANYVDLPTDYDYSTKYEPVQYIYSEPSKQESPALAINVIAKGFSGTPTAIQTNGAIRGVLAPNAMSISWDGQTIPNGVGVVICTNGSEMTLTLPANPLEGQTLIIIQGSDKRVYIVPSGDEVIYCGGRTRDKNNKFFSGTIGQFNIFVFIRGNWQLQFMNNRP